MNLKQNNGYVGIDMSVSVIIMLLLIPTIFGIVYSINSSRISNGVKSEAISIAVNAVEAAKGIEIKNLNEDNVFTELGKNYTVTSPVVKSTGKEAAITTEKAGYKVFIDITDYKESHSEALENIVKTVKATVTFKIKNKEQSIDLSTVIK